MCNHNSYCNLQNYTFVNRIHAWYNGILVLHCSDASNKYPDRSLNSTQSIPYRSKNILLGETFQGQFKLICIVR
jgi:hypothetical protein